MSPDIDVFYAEVYDVVRQIPAGRVLSYGRIAELVGWPRHSRLVGRAMHDAPLALELPCHRVVNSVGRTVPGWHQQAVLLMSEGVRIKANGCVDMRAHEWELEASYGGLDVLSCHIGPQSRGEGKEARSVF